MKSNVVLLLFICCFSMRALAGYDPVTITAGFNADLIANGIGDASSSSVAFDVSNNYAFVAANFQPTSGSSFPPYGLPSNGTINSLVTSSLQYQIASYSASNSLLLTSGTSSGTLSFSASNVGEIYLLTSATNGSVDFDATVNFSDGSTQTFSSLTASDWFSNSGYAIQGTGRVNLSDNGLENDASNPRMYQVLLNIAPGNYTKTITGISFTTSISGNSTMAIFAITKRNVCAGTPSVTTTNSSVTGACTGIPFTLSLAGLTPEPGMTYQWATSTDGSNWTPVSSGGDNATYTTTQTAVTYYRCTVTCTVSGLSVTTTGVQVNQNIASQCYCLPVANGGCSPYYINGVSITGENGVNLNNQNTGCSGVGYAEYISGITPVALLPYSTYTLNINSSDNSVYPYASVWIDINDNGSYDSNEMVGTTGSVGDTTLIIDVPLATTGTHRMRIRGVWYNFAALTDPCNGFYNSEAEDYLVNILPVPSCVHPFNLAVSNASGNGSATLSWDAGTAGTTYDWAVDASNTNNPATGSTITNISTAGTLVSGLTPGIHYFHLRAHCTATDSSIWIKKTVIIPSVCSTAVNLASGQIATGNNTDWTDVTLPATTCGDQFSAISHAVWYKVTPLATGNVTIATCNGTSWDSYLRVYSGDCNNLICVGYDDNACNNQASLTFTGTANQTYYILLTGYASYDFGAYNISATYTGVPVNNVATAAISLPTDGSSSITEYTNEYANAAVGEPFPSCSGVAGQHSVWFKFNAPASGAIKISTDNAPLGTLTNSKIALFSTNNVNDYTSYQIVACDDNNGINGSGNMSIIYATGLVGGNTYYLEVDGATTADSGTFHVFLQEINSTMVSSAPVSCAAFQQPTGNNAAYNGWISLVDFNGNIVANVKNPTGSAPADFSGSYTSVSGTLRQDALGTYYLSRNFYISNPGISTPVDVQLFMTPSELFSLIGFTSSGPNPVTQSNLNVTKQEGTTCYANYAQGNGAVSVLIQSSNSLVNGAAWIQVSTSSFSNFYLMGGTTPLPITLSDIAAVNVGSQNKITWTTAKEEVGDAFELEHSADGKSFQLLDKIAGNNHASDYTYLDHTPFNGRNYYRLKLMHNNSTFSYSKIVTAVANTSAAISIQASPNPATQSLKVSLSGTWNVHSILTLTDLSGRVLQSIPVNSNEMLLDLSRFVSGVYLLQYVDDRYKETIKISKQ